jgi:hypothetical protein
MLESYINVGVAHTKADPIEGSTERGVWSRTYVGSSVVLLQVCTRGAYLNLSYTSERTSLTILPTNVLNV